MCLRFGARCRKVVLRSMPFRDESYWDYDMPNAEIKRGLKGEDSGKFFNNNFAAFFDFCLKFAELFKFVEFHRAAGAAMLESQVPIQVGWCR